MASRESHFWLAPSLLIKWLPPSLYTQKNPAWISSWLKAGIFILAYCLCLSLHLVKMKMAKLYIACISNDMTLLVVTQLKSNGYYAIGMPNLYLTFASLLNLLMKLITCESQRPFVETKEESLLLLRGSKWLQPILYAYLRLSNLSALTNCKDVFLATK